jgi:tRNA (Thr-GGU) A37 N-methylase
MEQHYFVGRPRPAGEQRVLAESVRSAEPHLEALDGTPIVDTKPLLGPVEER